MTSPLERSIASTHRFAFSRAFRFAALPFGIRPSTCRVELLGSHLTATFGPWSLSTPISNIADAQPSGPYGWPKVIGPPHLSIQDLGITFATNPTAGVCMSFHEPVPGIEPFGRLRHPGLTVTVEEPERLIADLVAGEANLDELERDERAVLESRTASELRALASDLGIARASSMKKSDLVDRILSDDGLAGSAFDRTLAEGSAI